MGAPRLKFTYGNREYSVQQKALDKGKILLPNGTLLSIKQNRVSEGLILSQKDLYPEKVSQLFKGMIPVQLALLVGAVLAEEKLD